MAAIDEIPNALEAAWSHHQSGNFERAEQAYRKVLAADPSRAEVWYVLGAARVSLKQSAGALAAFQQAISLSPDYADAHNYLAVTLVEQQRFEPAIEAFRRAIELKPEDADLHANLGLAYSKCGKFYEAEEAYRQALGLQPDNAKARLGLQRILNDSTGLRSLPVEKAASSEAPAKGATRLSEAHSGSPPAPVAVDGLEAVLAAAWKAHEAHNWAEAERGYRQGLEMAPTRTNAWYLLGAVRHSQGDASEAIACFRRAIELDHDYADAHNYLATILVDAGLHEEAIEAFRQAVRLKPDNVDLRLNLALALKFQNRLKEAVEVLEQALELKPDHARAARSLRRLLRQLGRLEELIALYRRTVAERPDSPEALHRLALALLDNKQYDEAVASLQAAIELDPGSARLRNNLGLALAGCGRAADALAVYEQALKLKPDFAEVYNNCGVALGKLNRREDAEARYRRAIELKPEFAQAYGNLGAVLGEQSKFEESEACQRRALELNPKFADSHLNLGALFARQFRYAEAEAAYGRALELKPNYVEAHANLGAAYAGQGRLDEASECYEQALAIQADFPAARYNRSLAWLSRGRMPEGWADYEFRWKCDEFKGRRYSAPLWDGASLEGRTILVHAEQGLGDTLQFVRYLPLVKARGGRVLFACQRQLMPLLSSFPGVDQLLSREEPPPPLDVHAPLLSLPNIFRTSLADIPGQRPYLSARPELRDLWRSKLRTDGALAVGIAWQGNPKYLSDRFRSIPLEHFSALANLPGVKLFSLQKGFGSEQLRDGPLAGRIVDLASRLDETSGAFIDTTAVMSELDLVITSDTSLAHLAGALGAPTWLALCAIPDWRWLLEREDCPWYPNMRLFRQCEQGDWSDVFERIAAALIELRNARA